MASKSYGWDVRNIAKISPKMVKKGHFSTSEGKRPKPTPLPHMRLWFNSVVIVMDEVKLQKFIRRYSTYLFEDYKEDFMKEHFIHIA